MTTPLHPISHEGEEPVSPRSKGTDNNNAKPQDSLAPQLPQRQSLRESLEAMDMRTDPDAQATVTDFLDFTDHLSSDMVRSLTLIKHLDNTYSKQATVVDKLTAKWMDLPNLVGPDKPEPAQLRGEISEAMRLGMRSRIHAQAEAVHMSENVNRHHARVSTLLEKLRGMMENYPSAEEQEKSPATTSKQAPAVVKKPTKADGSKPKKMRAPKIIIPGEVLAPYELDDDSSSDGSDDSSSEEEPEPVIFRPPPIPASIKHRTGARLGRPPKVESLLASAGPAISAAAAAAVGMAHPPPANAPPGSTDAPWLRLTAFELAKLRKRMKKNATWSPSETMIARELNNLGRGPASYNAARRKAQEEGREFIEVVLPSQPDPGSSGHVPEGALTAEALADASLSASNKGMKLNEAKKLKREAMAKLAAEEAEALRLKAENVPMSVPQSSASQPIAKVPKETTPRPTTKRKRDPKDDDAMEVNKHSDSTASPTASGPLADLISAKSMTSDATLPPTSAPTTTTTALSPSAANTRGATKRIKVETPVPLPKISVNSSDAESSVSSLKAPSAPASSQTMPKSTTPVPLPAHIAAHASIESSAPLAPSAPSSRASTPVPVPVRKSSAEPQPQRTRKSTTPILPPTRETPRRETRAESAKKLSGAVSPTVVSGASDSQPEPVPAPTSSPRHSTPVPVSAAKPVTVPAAKSTPASASKPARASTPKPAAASTSKPAAASASKPTRASTPKPAETSTSKPAKAPTPKPAAASTSKSGNASTSKPTTSTGTSHRPTSRGKQAPEVTEKPAIPVAVNERPRRTHAARTTPQPGSDRAGSHANDTATTSAPSATALNTRAAQRAKRPANTTSSGDNSAVGKRKVATRKNPRASRKDKSPVPAVPVVEGEVDEFDEDGTPIDPNEPKYCVCNRVSFGTMIACENDDCKFQWFHLGCVGLKEIPRRTTKWYCPECRKSLNIGEKGEVTSRGVKT